MNRALLAVGGFLVFAGIAAMAPVCASYWSRDQIAFSLGDHVVYGPQAAPAVVVLIAVGGVAMFIGRGIRTAQRDA